MSKFCTNCGAKLEEDSIFCEECGTKVDQAVLSPEDEYKELPDYEAETEPAAPQAEHSAQKPVPSSGGIPKAAIIGAAFVLIAAAGVFFFFGGKGKPGLSDTGKPVMENVTDRKDEKEDSTHPYFQIEDEEAEPEAEEMDSGEETANADTGINGAEIAAKLSTAEIANAADFEWLLDYIMFGGSEAGHVITDQSLSSRVTDAAALNGGWKAYMFTENGTYGSDVERYLNVEIDTDGDSFDLIVNWKYFYDAVSGSSVDETHMDLFEGSYRGGTATVQSDFAKVELDEFYLSNDGKAEYAVGTLYWISGETERIGLMRTAR